MLAFAANCVRARSHRTRSRASRSRQPTGPRCGLEACRRSASRSSVRPHETPTTSLAVTTSATTKAAISAGRRDRLRGTVEASGCGRVPRPKTSASRRWVHVAWAVFTNLDPDDPLGPSPVKQPCGLEAGNVELCGNLLNCPTIDEVPPRPSQGRLLGLDGAAAPEPASTYKG